MPTLNYRCGRVQEDDSGMFATSVARIGSLALQLEVGVTPKPGLVDRDNTGAHQDMDFLMFMDSAQALYPYFCEITDKAMAYTGEVSQLLEKLQPIGIEAEAAMFRATNGVNTHKGALFSMGVMCAAAGIMASRPEQYPNTYASLSQLCAQICQGKVREAVDLQTKGQGIYKTYGLRGILGEAAAGYPHVFDLALPLLDGYLAQGLTTDQAGVMTLLQLIAVVEDTNIVARHGMATLQGVQAQVKQGLQTCIAPQSFMDYAQVLDQQFIQRNISPGGCADLLALAFFVHDLFHAPVQKP